MATRSRLQVSADLAVRYGGLEPDALIRAFRVMHTSRGLDDREILLKRQNRIFFQISGAGHEAISAAAGMALRAGHDWFYPYYRDRALCLAVGVTPAEMLLTAVGAGADAASGGRQMPSHWSAPRLNIVSQSSPTGTQFLQAVGCAEANRYLDPAGDAVALVTAGEGATSEGEFWEALNAACLGRLPVVFVVEDNGYAISVPVEKQTAGGNIARLVSSFPAWRSRKWTAATSSRPTKPCGRPPTIAAPGKAPRWYTPPAYGPTRIRFRTRRNFTRPPKSEPRKPRATR